MPFNGAGIYSPPPPPTFPAVSGELIRAADYNSTISDIASALTNCVTKDNQSTVPALTLGSLEVTGATNLGAGAAVGGEPILTRRYSTGEVILSISPTAPAGTLALNGQTIGSAASGGTARANADTQALFELLWTVADNTLLPIQDATGAATTRGLTAAADFAANKRMPLPTPQDGDALLAAVSSVAMSRTVGANLAHTHVITIDSGGAHNHRIPVGTSEGDSYTVTNGFNANSDIYTDVSGAHSHTASVASSGGSKNLAAGLYFKLYMAL